MPVVETVGFEGTVKFAGKVIVTVSPTLNAPAPEAVKCAVQFDAACATVLEPVKLTDVTGVAVLVVKLVTLLYAACEPTEVNVSSS
jgi:hypothetical protein